ncbi:GNAT family N-acetyltransferase [Angustibacter luteus]|uniref:GNAT family N-acetyltransferase n=1 Tax=Angustibacter luteus TaxID=658456 RepID=A0ABW1JGE6_9ACTN
MSAPGIDVSQVSAPTGQLVRLFDEYRQHYGERPDPAGSGTWLRQQLDSGALIGFLAKLGTETAGLALVAPTPASQRLGHFWQLRDLFVAPEHRRLGVGKALVNSVCSAAQAHGANRVSLVTEADNRTARDLYADAGFEAVAGYTSMSWSSSSRPEGAA